MEQDEFAPDAPVVVRGEVTVDAPQGVVWDLLIDVERWNRWNRGVQFAVLRGDPVAGTLLHWRADGMNLRSVLHEVDAPRRLAWTTRTLGAVAYHRWSLEPGKGGGTRVRSEESWDGLVVRLLRRTLLRTLQSSRRHWLSRIKARVEGGSSEESGSETAPGRQTGTEE